LSAIKATLNKLEFTSSKVLDGILKVLGYGGGVVLILWIFVFVGTVAARAFFHATPVYLEEYTEYFVVFIAATGLAYALRKGAHIRVSIAVERLPQRVRDIIEIFVALIALIVSCVLTAHGIKLVLFAISENVRYLGATQALLWPVYLCLPIGYGLLSLALFLYFCHAILAVVGKD